MELSIVEYDSVEFCVCIMDQCDVVVDWFLLIPMSLALALLWVAPCGGQYVSK